MEVFIILVVITAVIVTFVRVVRSDMRKMRGERRPAVDLPRNASSAQYRYSSPAVSHGYPVQYHYKRKYSLITPSEIEFFHMLTEVAGEKYHIFPQIHLSSLMTNETRGKYHLLSFQRINRRSVDYVLCDKQTFKPVYAVELDDPSHDHPKRRARDVMINQIFADIKLPLVRFRDYRSLSRETITQRFQEANAQHYS